MASIVPGMASIVFVGGYTPDGYEGTFTTVHEGYKEGLVGIWKGVGSSIAPGCSRNCHTTAWCSPWVWPTLPTISVRYSRQKKRGPKGLSGRQETIIRLRTSCLLPQQSSFYQPYRGQNSPQSQGLLCTH